MYLSLNILSWQVVPDCIGHRQAVVHFVYHMQTFDVYFIWCRYRGCYGKVIQFSVYRTFASVGLIHMLHFIYKFIL